MAGTGSIATAVNGVTVNQYSSRAIIDWNSFSISAGHSVFFNNGSGATLNRVMGGSLSQIDGLLGSTGSVFLINPSGVVIGSGGKVLTNGSFVTSTRDLSDSAFLSGGSYEFTGTSAGTVINEGTIASNTGDIVLVGKSVTNSGTVSAPQGTAALAAGDDVTLKPVGGDQRISVAAGTGSVTNSGAVNAAAAELKAADGNVYALAGNTGVIRATGTQTIGGHIWLTSNGGDVQVTGNALASNTDGSGGAVTVRGASIEVPGQIDASATAAGKNGGTVSVIATRTTTVSGSIIARGGKGAKGGFVETSGETLHVANSAKISTFAPDGITGTWLIDPTNFTIAASGGDITGSALSSELNGGTSSTNIDIESSAGSTGTSGDVIVNDAVSWSSAAKLTLGAVHSIDVNADITISGGGTLAMNTGAGDNYVIATGKSISFTGGSSAGAGLVINGHTYALEYSVAQLGSAIAANTSGYYALANDYNAGNDGTLSESPISTFDGTLAGLGNTISNLTITSTTSGSNVGLFSTIDSGATVRDIGLVGGSLSVDGAFNAGSLAGKNEGTILNAYSTGTVSSGDGTYLGGLVGYNLGTISESYATGAVTGGNTVQAGGLVGVNHTGAIVSLSYATGPVSGTDIASAGGLVGSNDGTISQTYAMGSVIVGDGGAAGGLNGTNHGTIDESYSIGAVSATSTNAYLGGLVGSNVNSPTSIEHSYFDTGTSGLTVGVSAGSTAGVTGGTTNDLQYDLPASFHNNVWASGSELFPYFRWRYPTNTPTSISGTAYGSGGATIAAGQVSLLIDGNAQASASIGANGYYYSLLPDDGSVMATSAILAYTTGAAAGARLDVADNAYDGDGISGFDIWGNTLIAPTAATTYSSAAASRLRSQDSALLAQAVGAQTDPTTGLAHDGYIAAGPFDIDTNLTLTNGLYVKSEPPAASSASSEVFVSGTLTLPGTAVLDIDAYYAEFANNVTVTGGGAIRMAVGDSGDNYKIDTGDSISFTGGSSSGASLTINSAPFTILYSMADVQALNDPTDNYAALQGNYALATSLNAASTTNFTPIGVNNAGNALGCGCGFEGEFAGLGHTISNLTVNRPTVQNVGLFGIMEGTVRDLGLIGGAFTGEEFVGALAGYEDGFILNSYSTATVTGTGINSGGDYVGGLVGYADFHSEIDFSYATGDVTAAHSFVGGLAGYNDGVIETSFAGGAVNGLNDVGGLVGINDDGEVTKSYATGAVASSGNDAGGLIGRNTNHSEILNSYALGAVLGGANVGGLAGSNDGTSTISGGYAIGAVSGSFAAGGFVGLNDGTSTITTAYWDSQTSGAASGIGSDANAQSMHVTAHTTAQLMDNLGALNGSYWATSSGLLPYLQWQSPNGTPQAITGFAYRDAGVTLASGSSGAVTVSALVDGAAVGSGTTGVNGFYYILAAPGTLSGTQQLLTYLNGNAINANTLVQSASGNTAADLYGDTLRLLSGASTTSAMFAALDTALGANSGSDFLFHSGAITSGTSLDVESSHSGGLAINTAINVGAGTIIINAAGPVTQAAALTAAKLDLLGGSASYVLGNAANAIGVIAANTGAITFGDNTNLTIGTVNGTVGITSGGAVTLKAAGDLTITSGAAVTAASGDDVVLSATGDFVNNAGAAAVAVSGGGRWLIYSNAPDGDTFGSLNSANTAIWDATYATLAPGSVTQSGNRYIFAYAPELTITTTDVSKMYGNNGTAAVAAAYTITGLQSGVANAFLGDTASTVYSGTPQVTSLGSAVATSVSGGPYAITASAGSLAASDSYSIAYNNSGMLTVTARPITITADDLSRIYGDANPSLAFSIGGDGMVNGDTLTGALTTTAATTSNIGGYSITRGSLAASSNYDIAFNVGTLTVTARPITITADDLSKVYGTADPSLTYSIGGDGLVNGDILTGALTRAPGESVAGGPYAIGQGSLTAASNYAVTFNGGQLTITPATLTASLSGLLEKTYDGSTLATTTGANYSLSGIVGSDSVEIVPVSGTYASKNVGSDIVVSVNGLTLTGVDASDYVLASSALSAAIGKIDPAFLTITANNLFAGTITSVMPTASYSGFVAGEGPSLVSGLTFAIGPTSSPATFFILPRGASASNYVITYVAGSLTLGTVENAFQVPGTSAEIWDVTTGNWPGQLPGFDLLPIILDTSGSTSPSPALITTDDATGDEYIFMSGLLLPRFDIDFMALLKLLDVPSNLGTPSP